VLGGGGGRPAGGRPLLACCLASCSAAAGARSQLLELPQRHAPRWPIAQVDCHYSVGPGWSLMKSSRLQKRQRALQGRGARDRALEKRQEEAARERLVRKGLQQQRNSPLSTRGEEGLTNGEALMAAAMAAAQERERAQQARADQRAHEQRVREDSEKLAQLVLRKVALLAAGELPSATTAQGVPGMPMPSQQEREALYCMHDLAAAANRERICATACAVVQPWPTDTERELLSQSRAACGPNANRLDGGADDPHAALLLLRWASLRCAGKRPPWAWNVSVFFGPWLHACHQYVRSCHVIDAVRAVTCCHAWLHSYVAQLKSHCVPRASCRQETLADVPEAKARSQVCACLGVQI
jgi:hypothetical protein